MRAYLDCEFSGLEAPSILISLALVSEDGQHIYIELEDGWTVEDCSQWVRQVVLPLLEGRPEVLATRAEAEDRVRSFLSSLDQPVTVSFDAAFDETHFLALVDPLPPGVQLENIREDIDPDILAGYFGGAEHGLRHHALVDAQALAYAHRVTLQMKQQAHKSWEDTQ